MSNKSLGDPFSPDSDLQHGPGCNCPICVFQREQAVAQYECSETELTERLERAVFEGTTTPDSRELVGDLPAEGVEASPAPESKTEHANPLDSPEDIMDRIIEWEQVLINS